MEEKAILLQAVVPIGERRLMVNAWFKIQPSLKISGPFQASQPPFRLGISSTFVGSDLYTIGGRVSNHFVLSDCISRLCTDSVFNVWRTSELPSPCADSVLGVYGESLCILPGVWKYGYYRMDENTYLTNQKGYIWNTKDWNITGIIEPPTWQWHRIRACAALDGEGLLIAMDGEENNFFLYNPEKNVWEIRKFQNPLPKFIGETSFAAYNGTLYILEVQDKSPAFLYIYDIKERRLVIREEILEFDDDFWSMDKWDRVVRLVPVADDELCFLWLGPVLCENENGWLPVRTFHYLKFKISICSDKPVEVVDKKVFCTNITDLLDCLPCDRNLFETKVLKDQPIILRTPRTAAGENTPGTEVLKDQAILFQAVVPSGEGKLMMNAWFKIQPTLQICGPFHGRQPFRLGTSSTFVGSSLYTIGGEVPSSRLRKSGYISWLDTHSPFNGWEVGELPSPCVDSVICVYGDSLYILNEPEGYIWNTTVNKCLETRILPPKVEGGERQWRRIRACAALDGQGLLIAMDGEENNFFLYKPEENDWEICKFRDPLPKFIGKTSFAASKERLYILEVKDIAHLYIYDITKGKLMKAKMPHAYKLRPLYNWEKVVVRLVPVADDKLCLLWFVSDPPPLPYGIENMRDPLPLLQYLKVKFSFSPNPSCSEVEVDVEVEDSSSFNIKNVINLLDCLPCGHEQFTAEMNQLLDCLPCDASEKQHEDNACPEKIGTSLISGKPFQGQAEDIASPKEKRKRKGRRTLLVYPLLRRQRKISKDKGDFNMTEPGQSSEAKNPSFSSGDDDKIVESDVELDNTDVGEPDNDPLQKLFAEIFDVVGRRRKEREIKRAVKLIEISFSIYDMRRQKSKQDQGALSAFRDGQVIDIHSNRELETKLNAATKTSRLVILYFTAKWCRPSVKMSPLYTSLAAKYPEVIFLKVDINEAEDVDDDFDISGVPTFIFMRNWKVIDEVIGAHKGALKTKTAHYAVIQSFLDKM